jgi:cytoskeletal protein CcmA (bactofilin family)
MTATRSYFAPDLIVTGTVTSRGSLELDGLVEGDLSVTSLILKQAGTITGNAQADEASLAGRLTGTIRAHKITVTQSGRLSGLVEYDLLGIQPGGTFEAECRPTTAPALETDRSTAGQRSGPARRGAGRLAAGPA